MDKPTLIASAVVLLLWSGTASAQDGPNVNLPGIKEPDTTAGSCSHGGRNYPSGTVICKDGFQQKCGDGGWENRGFECPPDDTAPNGASIPAPAVFQRPPPDQPLEPEQLQPAEP